MTADYGDFKEISYAETPQQPEGEGVTRARMPRRGEFIGVIIQRLGGNRMDVFTTDGKSRNCRVPGKYKRSLWLRPKDIVLIVPWVDDNEKGDIIFKYQPAAISFLRKKGILDSLKRDF